jgi:hypothetical protein
MILITDFGIVVASEEMDPRGRIEILKFFFQFSTTNDLENKVISSTSRSFLILSRSTIISKRAMVDEK